jgi:hypothetical protein
MRFFWCPSVTCAEQQGPSINFVTAGETFTSRNLHKCVAQQKKIAHSGTYLISMRKMATMGEIQGHDAIVWLKEGCVNLKVGR